MNLLEQANQAVWKNFETVSKQPFRLQYHLMPPTNWMNDPNGMIYFKGKYHVYYQHYPYGTIQGPMYWGHASSNDLVHWQHCPIALAPDTEYDASCFSGSAVVSDDVLTFIYTSHDGHRTPKEMQSVATSQDGIHFTKDADNPVLRQPPMGASFDFRDPKVWSHDGQWYMVLGSSCDGKGQALLYRSDNLRNWLEVGVVLASNGSYGHMWECPDIYKLGGRDVLAFSPIQSPISRNTLIVGNLDYSSGRFDPIKYQEADFGEDFYAMQSMLTPDGRRIMLAWMEKWRDTYVTAREGWIGAMTIMRELSLENNRVWVRPVREMALLRDVLLTDSSYHVELQTHGHLRNVSGNTLEICVELDLNNEQCQKGGLRLRTSADGSQETLVYFDRQRQAVICDRSHSGLGSTVETAAPVVLGQDKKLSLQIFIDRSSIEIFINNGEAVMTNRIYPDFDSTGYDLFAVGGSMDVPSLKVWTIRSIWPDSAN
jgi:beta-fructofuranosidase